MWAGVVVGSDVSALLTSQGIVEDGVTQGCCTEAPMLDELKRRVPSLLRWIRLWLWEPIVFSVSCDEKDTSIGTLPA